MIGELPIKNNKVLVHTKEICAVLIVAIIPNLWYELCYIHLKDEKRCKERIILKKRKNVLMQRVF